MQTKDLWSINRWKRLDSFKELLQTAAFGDLVTSVETEVIGEHVLSKPYLMQKIVIIIKVFFANFSSNYRLLS